MMIVTSTVYVERNKNMNLSLCTRSSALVEFGTTVVRLIQKGLNNHSAAKTICLVAELKMMIIIRLR